MPQVLYEKHVCSDQSNTGGKGYTSPHFPKTHHNVNPEDKYKLKVMNLNVKSMNK